MNMDASGKPGKDASSKLESDSADWIDLDHLPVRTSGAVVKHPPNLKQHLSARCCPNKPHMTQMLLFAPRVHLQCRLKDPEMSRRRTRLAKYLCTADFQNKTTLKSILWKRHGALRLNFKEISPGIAPNAGTSAPFFQHLSNLGMLMHIQQMLLYSWDGWF